MKKIAIVEDSQPLTRVWSSILNTDRYEHHIISSHPADIERLAAQEPDTIVFSGVPEHQSAKDLVLSIKRDSVLQQALLVLSTSLDSGKLGSFIDTSLLDGILIKPFNKRAVLELLDKFCFRSIKRSRERPLVAAVDDSKSIRNLLSKKLNSFGYDVITAENGKEGMELVRERTPDIVLADMTMPVMSGTEMCASLSEEPMTRTIPVIIVSAVINETVFKEGFAAGATDYIQKPFKTDHLRTKITSLLESTGKIADTSTRSLILGRSEVVTSRLVRFFDRIGTTCHVATTMSSFDSMVNILKPDLMLMEVNANQTDEDLETCRELRSRDDLAGIPLVVVSAQEDRNLVLGCLREGANDFIKVPFANEEIYARIQNLFEMRRLQRELESKNRTLSELAYQDGLTGLYNRAYFDRRLMNELAKADENSQPLGLCLLDLDHFKNVNDTHGHQIGDAVLKETATRVSRTLRPEDIPCRYGGEELAVILPGASLAEALSIGERLRSACNMSPMSTERIVQTCSVGVSVYPDHSTGKELIAAADKALYQAKDGGRNKVVLAE